MSAQQKPPIGTHVVDTARNKIGRVMDHRGSRIQLRPLEGGREWDAEPAAVRHATPAEVLSAKVKVANAGERWGK